MSARARVAVCGASGYVGAELVRWLLSHPRVDLVAATAGSRAGERLDAVHPQFTGRTDLVLDGRTPAQLAPEVDALFLALPHGEVAAAVATLGPDSPGLPLLVDLSGDHRIPSAETWRAAYGRPHPAPGLIHQFAYGLPEQNRARIATARRIANPGCFASALALALLPLARAGLLAGPVPVFGLTGSSGSGATPSATTHHPARAENARLYKVLSHQHVPEVEVFLRQAAPEGAPAFRLDFVPVSAPLVRGILVSALPRPADPLPPGRASDLYRESYAGERFVSVVARSPEPAAVRGTNRAEVAVFEGPGGSLAASCAIDNLARGAATQAVANLNLAMGWPEALGIDAIAPVP